MRLPTSKKKYRTVFCMGGPWAAKYARFPVQCSGDDLSLLFTIGNYTGQYNLNTGEWVPHG